MPPENCMFSFVGLNYKFQYCETNSFKCVSQYSMMNVISEWNSFVFHINCHNKRLIEMDVTD